MNNKKNYNLREAYYVFLCRLYFWIFSKICGITSFRCLKIAATNNTGLQHYLNALAILANDKPEILAFILRYLNGIAILSQKPSLKHGCDGYLLLSPYLEESAKELSFKLYFFALQCKCRRLGIPWNSLFTKEYCERITRVAQRKIFSA